MLKDYAFLLPFLNVFPLPDDEHTPTKEPKLNNELCIVSTMLGVDFRCLGDSTNIFIAA
jgi:hypothetical protein